MNELRWMAGTALVSWLAATVATGGRFASEMLFGMLGPLTAVIGSWVMAERTYRMNPERLTATMISAFAAKVVFFGAYVVVMLTVLALRPIPFIVSFTAYFIVLYALEALYLRRLFIRGTM